MGESANTVILDTTTLAGAGRFLHEGDLDTPGGIHADNYYSKYGDKARLLDQDSFAEFLTAITLFDSVIWDASSNIQVKMGDGDPNHGKGTWLYSYFPKLDEVREDGILGHFSQQANEPLGHARRYSLEWVRQNYTTYKEKKEKAPAEFKIPNAYKSPDYQDREAFVALMITTGLSVDDDQLALAMFLHRGLYYQSAIWSEAIWAGKPDGYLSYMPHAFRQWVLSEFQDSYVYSLMCSIPRSIQIDGAEILKKLDQAFQEELNEWRELKPMAVGTSLGYAFLQQKEKPEDALREALSFWKGSEGEKMRRQFKDIVEVGVEKKKKAVEERVKEIAQSLEETALGVDGGRLSPQVTTSFKLLPQPGPAILDQLISLIPVKWQQEVTKWLYIPFNRTGFQILFSKYL